MLKALHSGFTFIRSNGNKIITNDSRMVALTLVVGAVDVVEPSPDEPLFWHC